MTRPGIPHLESREHAAPARAQAACSHLDRSIGWACEHACSTNVPTGSARLAEAGPVVVIGGGVIGASIAYHLAHLGVTDVLVLERDRPTSGTTWHAAGLMTCFGSTSETSTALRLYSRDLYAALEAETGVATGFKPVGLIEAAADADRLHEYRWWPRLPAPPGPRGRGDRATRDGRAFPLARTDDLLPASTCRATGGSTWSTSR